MRHAVIGLGETGRPLYELLAETYCDTYGYDAKEGPITTDDQAYFLHICLPWQIKDFIGTVKEYQDRLNAAITVIHSTVPIGTTSQIFDAVHSPILGDHTNMESSLRAFPKWIGGELAVNVVEDFEAAGMTCIAVPTSEETEALKLMCLAKYGMSIAFAQYQKELCDRYGFSYEDVLIWDQAYNENVDQEKRRPILTPPGKRIGGHCITPGTRILHMQHPNSILWEILHYE